VERCERNIIGHYTFLYTYVVKKKLIIIISCHTAHDNHHPNIPRVVFFYFSIRCTRSREEARRLKQVAVLFLYTQQRFIIIIRRRRLLKLYYILLLVYTTRIERYKMFVLVL
jgi:hypothetical protein